MESESDDYYGHALNLLFTVEPFSANQAVGVGAILILLIGSALISASETAFFSMSAKERKMLSMKKEAWKEKTLLLLDKPRQLLATILIANNFLNVGIIVISYYLINSVINPTHHPVVTFLLEVGAVTAVIVIFGEVIPKIFAAYNNLQTARVMAGPLTFLNKALAPLSYLLVSSTGLIEKKLSHRSDMNINLEEVGQAIDLSVGSKDSREMLKSILKFGNINVRQVMKARVDVVSLDYNDKFDKVMETIREHQYSRIPVFVDSDDNVAGILYAKDLLRHMDDGPRFRWQELIRIPFFVPETKMIDDLLKEFQTKRMHMAIVVDEYGGTSGIITLEDIMEEIIGDISDEFDEGMPVNFTRVDMSNYVFEGKTQLNDFCRVTGIDAAVFSEIPGEFDSLAGLILELAGRLPAKDEQLKYKNFIFTVLSVGKKRIKKVKLTLLKENAPAAGS